MASQKILKKLLQHRGPVWYVKEEHVPGNDLVCPRCSGKGTCEVMESDCRCNSWTETRTCDVCKGARRVSKTYRVEKDDHWYFEVTREGVKLSHFLKDRAIYLSEEEARNEAERRSKPVLSSDDSPRSDNAPRQDNELSAEDASRQWCGYPTDQPFTL